MTNIELLGVPGQGREISQNFCLKNSASVTFRLMNSSALKSAAKFRRRLKRLLSRKALIDVFPKIKLMGFIGKMYTRKFTLR